MAVRTFIISTVTEVADGTASWSNPGNAAGSADLAIASASVALTGNTNSNRLQAEIGLQNAFPAKAVITGLEMKAYVYATGFGAILYWGVATTNASILITPSWSNSIGVGAGSTIVRGGAGDLLASSPVPTGANFKTDSMGIRLYVSSSASSQTVSLDALELSVYYSSGGFRSRERGFGRQR